MKTTVFPRLALLTGVAILLTSITSCMTTYDANGNPVQSVDPGAAAAGAVAAGVLGYAIASDRNDNNYYYGGGPYYRGGNYYRGGSYYRGGRYYSGGRSYNGYRGGYRGGKRR